MNNKNKETKMRISQGLLFMIDRIMERRKITGDKMTNSTLYSERLLVRKS
jgi:hypothetical protein